MTAFIPGRAQDAAHTIRGFKYQIQLTMLRWLSLAEDEVLYLECGEDIDRVLRSPDEAGTKRELEQIKATGRNVTLRSPEVLCALANFSAHIKANPGAALRFRFTTSASVGREKLSSLGKDKQAIDVWQELQAKNQWNTNDDELVQQIAQLIAKSSRPKKCSEEAWDTLMDIANGVGPIPFPMFILHFEWSCGMMSPDDLEAQLKDHFKALPDDTGPADPSREQRYSNLFRGLMDILSRTGEKKLTRDLLNSVLRQPTLTEHDRARLSMLEKLMESQSEILISLQDSVQNIELANLVPLIFGHSADTLESLNISSVLSDPPPLVETLSQRSETVAALSHNLVHPRLLWIHGDYGMGKSHLGFLLAERSNGVVLGVSMRGLTSLSAEQGLALLVTNSTIISSLACNRPGVVLLDDVPECEPQSRLEMLVGLLAKHAIATGRTMILTSRRPPSATIAATLRATLVEIEIPRFSNADAMELFSAHKVATDLLTELRVANMNTMCSGHPMLLTALARHLTTCSSEPDMALVEALLANSHRTEIDLATSRAVLKTVEVEACRNLLFRLASSGTAMSLDEIRSIAAIDPALPEPTGCVARLDGLWLRRTAEKRYEVSPLATPLGREVPSNVNKSVHTQTARLVLKRRRISTSEFMRAITSFVIAGEYHAAASYLVYGCIRWPSKDAGYGDLGVLLFFPPEKDFKLGPATELALRSVQAVTAAVEEKDTERYLRRMETLVQNPTPEVALGALFAGSIILTSSLEIPMRVATFAANLVEQFRASPLLPEEMAGVVPSYPDGVHLLLPTACIRNWDDLDAFVDLLASLDTERRHEVGLLPEVRRGVRTVLWRPLFTETHDITDGAFERLSQLELRSRNLGCLLLAAYAVVGRLVILGEYEHDVGRMLEEAKNARKNLASDPMALSVLEATVGQQLYANGQYSDALKHLTLGLAESSHIIGLERGNRLVDAIATAWQLSINLGPYADELVEMLSEEEFDQAEVQCQMHAQVALVRWRQDRREDAFKHFESSVIRFFELDDHIRTRQLGAGLAHSINYYAMLAETGEPPPHAADGGPYSEPDPQMFLGTKDGMAGMWQVRQGPAMLKWALGRLADALGFNDAYATWTDCALDAAHEANSAVLLAMLAPRGISAALRLGAWEDATEAAIVAGRANVFIRSQPDGVTAFEDSIQFDPLQSPGSPTQRQQAEEFSLWVFSRAIVAELGPSVLAAQHGPSDLNSLAEVIERAGEQLQIPRIWKAFAHSVRLAVGPQISDQQYRDALSTNPNGDLECIRFVAHGLLALRLDVRLGQAAVSQVGILHHLAVTARPLEVTLDTYAAAVCQYWAMAIKDASFRFTSPREVKKAIEEADGQPPMRRAKMILRVVVVALSAPLSVEDRVWLSAY